MALDFSIDCLISLLKWKFSGKTAYTRTQYTISSNEIYRARRFSMDACIIYENCLLKVYDAYVVDLGARDWVIDVGAHIGTFSIHLLRRFPKLRIISLEPYPATYRLLHQNVRLNNLESSVKTINSAIAKTNGRGQLFVDHTNTGGNSIVGHGSSLPVQLTTLDRVFSKHNITHCLLLKLDCEGAEYDILMNMPHRVLKKIKTIIMETHAGYDQMNLIQFLQNAGFSVRTTPNAITHPILRQFLTIPLSIATR